jgi:hypothetical protein
LIVAPPWAACVPVLARRLANVTVEVAPEMRGDG